MYFLCYLYIQLTQFNTIIINLYVYTLFCVPIQKLICDLNIIVNPIYCGFIYIKPQNIDFANFSILDFVFFIFFTTRCRPRQIVYYFLVYRRCIFILILNFNTIYVFGLYKPFLAIFGMYIYTCVFILHKVCVN